MVEGKSIVLFGGLGLGDNLVQMILGENARLAGYSVTMLSSIMCGLSRWFPHIEFQPSILPDQFETVLNRYDTVLWSHEPLPSFSDELRQRWVGYEKYFTPDNNRVQNMARAGRKIFSLETTVESNGLVIPGGLVWRKNERRVLLHPTSAEKSKNWLPAKFVNLADRLTSAGLEPVFVMSRPERHEWENVASVGYTLKGFDTVDSFAEFLFESGYFIGNDSGGGHLASNLNIPTLSIHGRKSKARDWQPGWGIVEVVTPTVNLVGGYLRQRYWKYMLSVSAVEKAFYRLTTRSSKISMSGICDKVQFFVHNDLAI